MAFSEVRTFSGGELLGQELVLCWKAFHFELRFISDFLRSESSTAVGLGVLVSYQWVWFKPPFQIFKKKQDQTR